MDSNAPKDRPPDEGRRLGDLRNAVTGAPSDPDRTPDPALRTSAPETSAPAPAPVLAETVDPSATTPFVLTGGSGAPTVPGAPLPERIGRYRIISVLGRGGMGVVYEAEQEQPRRHVALKVVAPHMISQSLLRRFEMEAEVLGRLEHPGVAKVYEAGTADAGSGPQPFFAMELVRGEPLNVFADRQKLDVRARLDLLARVCDAVHHAHQKGVIHRDLKSANILVTSDGQPKVLDFGVARATDADVRSATMETGVGQLIGTLPYMSPEQAGGDPRDLDTRSDVYGLGVVAYELLSGRLPYALERRLVHEAVRIIREDEPSRLSSVDRALSGDVETIVAKAMEKDKSRRYQSASDMAADVRRYLHDEPVTARPASAIYQLQKFARRNRTLVAGAAATLAVLVLGVVATSWQAVRASRGESSARENATRAESNAAEARQQESAARQNAANAQRRWAESLVAQGTALVGADRWAEGRSRIEEAQEKFAALGVPTREADMALWNLHNASPPALMEFRGHTEPISGVAHARDGMKAISGSRDGTVKLWELSTGRALRTFTGGGGAVSSVAIAPDGGRILAGNSDGTIRTWDADTGREGWTFSYPSKRAVKCLAVAPDGNTVVSGTNGPDNVKGWDLRTGKERWSFTARTVGSLTSQVTGVAITPDGLTAVVSTFAGDVSTCDLETGVATHRFTDPRQAGFGMGMALSPDGKLVALGAVDGTVTLWDLPVAKQIVTIGGQHNTVRGVAFSPDGRTLLSGASDSTIKLVDVATGKLLRTFFHDTPVATIVFAPDGATAVSGSHDGVMKRWSLAPGRESRVLSGDVSPHDQAAFSPDGRVVIFCRGVSNRSLVMVDAATGKELRTVPGLSVGRALDVTRDGNFAVFGSNTPSILMLDLRTGKVLRRFQTGQTFEVLGVAVGGDGKTALTASAGNPPTPQLWDLALGKELRRFVGHTGALTCVAMSPDGRTGLSGSEDATVRVWDLNTGQELRRFAAHASKIDAVAFSPDGRFAISADDAKDVKTWDVATGAEIASIPNLGGVPRVAIVPEGDVALFSIWDGTMRMWDLKAGRELSTVRQPSEGSFNSNFVPDGRAALSWGTDRVLRYWDFGRVATYREFAGRVRDAVATLQKTPDDAPALRTLGEWYAFRGEWGLAEDFLRRARDGGSDMSHLTLGRVYWLRGKVAEARQEFRSAFDRNEAPADYLNVCLEALDRPSPSTTAPLFKDLGMR